MDLISHIRYSFHRNYGIFFTYLQRWIECIYLKIRYYLDFSNSGMFFDYNMFMVTANGRKWRYKKEGTAFFRMFLIEPTENDLQKTIKYGAMLYTMMILLAMPAVICSYQHQVPAIDLPEIASPQISPHMAVQNEILVALPSVEPLDPLPEVQSEVPPFHDFIMQASNTYKVEAALIRAIIMVESSNNPRAVSRRGAKGLMQLMPTTAKWLGVDDSFDPALNIDGGVRYFKTLLDRFEGNVQLALAAYNAGSRHVRNYNGVPPFKATRIYIKKVLKYRQEYQKKMASNESSLNAA